MSRNVRSRRSRGAGATLSALSTTLLAVALNTSTAGAIEEVPQDEARWGEWQPMASGYAARRREPQGLGEKLTDRRPAAVQQRASKQHSLERRAGTTGKPIALRSVAGSDSVPVATASATAATGPAYRSAWLYTANEGLYAITIAELATQLGRTENNVRDKATTGSLRVLRGPAGTRRATEAVSWHFDPVTDSILFAARTFDSFHTELDAYRILLGGAGTAQAAPMSVSTGTPSGIANASPFRDTLTFEEEPDMLFLTWVVAEEPEADYWFWDYLYGGSRDTLSLPLAIPDPAPSGTAEIVVRLRGFTDQGIVDEHVVDAAINGQYIGTVMFSGMTAGTLTASFDQSLLDSEGNNTLELSVVYSAGTNPGQFLDDVQVSYNRLPIARGDSLWLHATPGGTQSVAGFTSDDIIVVENPNSASAAIRQDVEIVPGSAGDWQVSFDAADNDSFLVATRSSANTGTLARDYMSGLGSTKRSAEYLIIAPRDFSGTALNMAYYRFLTYGSVSVAWLEDIYQQFNAGRAEPAALANFMQYVVNNWQGPPSTVLLVGKGSLDLKDRMGYSDGFLPVALTGTPYALAVSESRLLGFEDDPPFSIGRLPIVSDAEGMAYMQKLAAHEATLGESADLEALLIADNADQGGNFPLNNTYTAARLVDELGFTATASLEHPGDDIGAALAQSSTWNRDLVIYDGHGSVAQAGNAGENFMLAEGVAALANERLPIFTALTCAVGDHSYPATRSLAAALVLNPGGGAVTSVVPSGLSLDTPAQYLGEALTDGLYLDGLSVGAALQEARRTTTGSVQPFVSRMYNVVGDPAVVAR